MVQRSIFTALLILASGCAATQIDSNKLAVPQPLVALHGGAAVGSDAAIRVATGRAGSMQVLAVRGSRGEMLNLAAGMHRILHSMGIKAEIRCSQQLAADRAHKPSNRVEIHLPDGLVPHQIDGVRRVLFEAATNMARR